MTKITVDEVALYRTLDTLVELNESKGWISVDERLPEPEQIVDVLKTWIGRDNKRHYQRYTDVEYYPDMAFPWISDDIDRSIVISYWMPLPPNPKKKL